MSFNTTKPADPKKPVTFAAQLPPALFGGASALGVSFWVRFTGRGDDNGMLFGNIENYGNDTNAFQLNFSSTERFLFRVALKGTDGNRVYTTVVTSPNAMPGAWNHWWFTYRDGRLTGYLNGVFDASVARAFDLPLWTPPAADYAIQLRGNPTAERTDFGEIAIWRDSLPTMHMMGEYRRGGELPAGAVLRLMNFAAPDLPSPRFLLDDAGSSLFWAKTPGGIFTPEVAGVVPARDKTVLGESMSLDTTNG